VVADYLRVLRLFSRDLRLFLVTAVLVGVAWDGMRAVLLNLYLLRLGYGPESVGLINSVGGLAFALMCLPAGLLGTRHGSRSMLITGLGLLTIAFFLLPLAELLTAAWRMASLLATTFLAYLGLALYLVNSLPFLMEVTGPEERNHAFSVHIALIPVAAVAGSLLAGLLPGATARLLGTSLDQAAAYRFPLWLAALLLIPSVLVLLPARPRTRSPASATAVDPPELAAEASAGRADPFPYLLILTIGLLLALRFGGRGTVVTFFNVYLDDGLGASAALIGILSAIAQLLSVPAALLAPLLTARWGTVRTIFWGTLAMALFALPLALVPHWAAAGIGFAGTTALFFMTSGPIRMFSQELVAGRWRAAMASSFMLGNGLALSAAALAGGYIIVSLGYPALFLVATGLMGAGALLFWSRFHSSGSEGAGQPLAKVGE
jgi:predicted MFS family arabinose efflux permease